MTCLGTHSQGAGNLQLRPSVSCKLQLPLVISTLLFPLWSHYHWRKAIDCKMSLFQHWKSSFLSSSVTHDEKSWLCSSGRVCQYLQYLCVCACVCLPFYFDFPRKLCYFFARIWFPQIMKSTQHCWCNPPHSQPPLWKVIEGEEKMPEIFKIEIW